MAGLPLLARGPGPLRGGQGPAVGPAPMRMSAGAIIAENAALRWRKIRSYTPHFLGKSRFAAPFRPRRKDVWEMNGGGVPCRFSLAGPMSPPRCFTSGERHDQVQTCSRPRSSRALIGIAGAASIAPASAHDYGRRDGLFARRPPRPSRRLSLGSITATIFIAAGIERHRKRAARRVIRPAAPCGTTIARHSAFRNAVAAAGLRTSRRR